MRPVEMRSFYGGLEFGIAAFLLICAGRPALVPAGIRRARSLFPARAPRDSSAYCSMGTTARATH
jgi:hypothetical protein